MMLLLFNIENDFYGIDFKFVSEIIPLVNCEKLPGAPDFVTGVINIRGRIIPIIDLSKLLCDKPSRKMLSTRIIIIDNQSSGKFSSIGLIAEKVTEAITCDSNDFQETDIGLGENWKILVYMGKTIRLFEPGSILLKRISGQSESNKLPGGNKID